MTRILVIDDSRLSRRMTLEILNAQEYETIEAVDGKEGLVTFHEELPDLVVTDLLMPVMDGPSFIKELRAGGSEVPVIVVSADIQAASRNECEQLGISAFLNKPVDKDALIESVQTALSLVETSP